MVKCWQSYDKNDYKPGHHCVYISALYSCKIRLLSLTGKNIHTVAFRRMPLHVVLFAVDWVICLTVYISCHADNEPMYMLFFTSQ